MLCCYCYLTLLWVVSSFVVGGCGWCGCCAFGLWVVLVLLFVVVLMSLLFNVCVVCCCSLLFGLLVGVGLFYLERWFGRFGICCCCLRFGSFGVVGEWW